MFACFVIFFFICSKRKPELKGEQLQLSAADARRLIPLGKISLCSFKQANPWDAKKWNWVPPAQQPPLCCRCRPRCCLLAEAVGFGAGAAESAAHAQCGLGCGGGRWWPCRWAHRAGMEPPTSSAASALGVVLLCSSGGARPDPAELLPTIFRHMG